jgi:hypothetical protein
MAALITSNGAEMSFGKKPCGTAMDMPALE